MVKFNQFLYLKIKKINTKGRKSEKEEKAEHLEVVCKIWQIILKIIDALVLKRQCRRVPSFRINSKVDLTSAEGFGISSLD